MSDKHKSWGSETSGTLTSPFPMSPSLVPTVAQDENNEIVRQLAASLPTITPYSAFSLARRRFILGVVTAAGFFGPLCGAVYLPSIVLFQDIFHTSGTVINATISVYMAVFAIAVSVRSLFGMPVLTMSSRSLALQPRTSQVENRFTYGDWEVS